MAQSRSRKSTENPGDILDFRASEKSMLDHSYEIIDYCGQAI
jgi:hypothetical protein